MYMIIMIPFVVQCQSITILAEFATGLLLLVLPIALSHTFKGIRLFYITPPFIYLSNSMKSTFRSY